MGALAAATEGKGCQPQGSTARFRALGAFRVAGLTRGRFHELGNKHGLNGVEGIVCNWSVDRVNGEFSQGSVNQKQYPCATQ
jgi:hypothetical protein